MQIKGGRARDADIVFAWWFGLQATLIAFSAALRPFAEGAYYDLGPAMVIVFGFIVPAALFLVYNVALFFHRREPGERFSETARKLGPQTVWRKRSLAAFGVAFLVNAAYCLPWTVGAY